MLKQNLKVLLDLYGDEIKMAIQQRLKKEKKYATGKAHNQLKKKVTANSLSIEGWKYIEVISGGREPGKEAPPLHKIIQWLNAKKGMSIKSDAYKGKKGRIGSLAFIIARNIGKNGIKGNNMLTDIRNNIIPRFDEDLANFIQAEILRITANVGNQKTN
jgi:hypothetical protein